MKILFDQNVPRNLAAHLLNHSVTRSAELGWQELKNGNLLKAAEERGFDLLVTADQNLAYQNNLKGRSLAIVVLPSGQWPTVKTRIPEIVKAVDQAHIGSFSEIAPLSRPRRKPPGPSI